MNKLVLEFSKFEASAMARAAAAVSSSSTRVVLSPWGGFASAVADALRAEVPGIAVLAGEAAQDLPDGISSVTPDITADVHVICENEPAAVDAALMALLDLSSGAVIAPRVDGRGLGGALFLISIPKAGTHMLVELVQALGFRYGGVFRDVTSPGHWYALEYSNTHTTAPDFFVDTVRRAPHGNRLHPFPSTPCLFIYRHPLDILISEAGYYSRQGKVSFSGYLAPLESEARILRLIDDPWLFGRFTQRIGQFAAWLDFPNVIPVSFEEIVGDRGGGDDALQQRTVWSLMLKLHVPGDAVAIAGKVFNIRSPTFAEGRIGRHDSVLGDAAWSALAVQDRAVFDVFGYRCDKSGARAIPARAKEFRSRPLLLAPPDEGGLPVLIEQDFLGYNIVYFDKLFYGLELGPDEIDVTALAPNELSGLANGVTISQVHQVIIRRVAADEIAKRSVKDYDDSAGPQLVEEDFLGYNIVYFDKVFYGLGVEFGDTKLEAIEADSRCQLLSAPSVSLIRLAIIRKIVAQHVHSY